MKLQNRCFNSNHNLPWHHLWQYHLKILAQKLNLVPKCCYCHLSNLLLPITHTHRLQSQHVERDIGPNSRLVYCTKISSQESTLHIMVWCWACIHPSIHSGCCTPSWSQSVTLARSTPSHSFLNSKNIKCQFPQYWVSHGLLREVTECIPFLVSKYLCFQNMTQD